MKFNIGDLVKVVNYGGWVMIPNQASWKSYHENTKYPIIKKEEEYTMYDTRAHMLGQEGIVESVGSDEKSWGIRTKQGYSAWYSVAQLEMINENPNKI